MRGLGESVWRRPKPSHVWMLVGACAALAALVLVWKHGAPQFWPDPTRVSLQLARFSSEAWAPFAMLGVYVLAGFILFPVVVLITATALVFEPWHALAIALGGALASTAVLHLVGVVSTRGPLLPAVARAIERMEPFLQGRGILAVMFIRMLPVAPFGLVGVGTGVLGISLRDTLIGTALGMAPGLLVITAFGRQLRAVLDQPSVGGVALLGGLLLVWLGIAAAVHRFASSARRAAKLRESSGRAPGSGGEGPPR